jgi:O-antigen/teichoic acid export membrane protein
MPKTMLKNTFFSYLSKNLPAVIAFVYTIIISNLLGPESYGLYNYLPALLVGFLVLFGGDFFDNLLWTFTSRTKSKNLFKKIFVIEIALIIIILIIVNVFSGYVSGIIGIADQELILIASLFLIFTPINSLFGVLFKAFSKFGTILKATLIESVTTLGLSIIFVVFLGMGLEGAFISRFIAIFVSILFLARQMKTLKFENKPISRKAIWKFSKWNISSKFIRNLKNQLQTIIMGVLISPAALGFYYLGQKITNIFVLNATNALAETLFSKNSENFDKKDLISIQTSFAIKASLLLNIIFGIILLLIAPIVVNIVFPQYTNVLIYIPLFAIHAVVMAQAPVTNIFDSINETQNNLKLGVLMLVLVFVLMLPLTMLFGLFGLMIAFILFSEINVLATIFLLRKHDVYISVIPRLKDIIELKRILIRQIKERK